jgi:hypothetical protein
MFDFLSLQREMFACPTKTQFDPSLKLLKKALGDRGVVWKFSKPDYGIVIRIAK